MGNEFKPKRVLFAGCGNMGSAILDAVLKSKVLVPGNVTILERFESEKILSFQTQGATWKKELSEILDSFDVIILAVKPQDSEAIMNSLGSYVNETGMVISIMAGVNIATMESHFPFATIVRAMPNTPASIGEGATGVTMSKNWGQDEEAWAHSFFGSFGKALFVDSENKIDEITAISGSGPAYLFYLAEAMTEQAIEFGFKPKSAQILVNQTLRGAAMLLDQSGESASDLRAKVTSKGGTTFAATEEFDAKSVKKGIKDGIQKAFERSKELGG
ncbi:MAG: pyrroline-5-carboxylate reductase [SAR324 cluster bacterium]|nr:pyrroline-5-carboxylate reductase [SAR324 cluster bacterium]